MARYHGLSPETIDGLKLEARLAANQKITQRRKEYWSKIAAFRERTKHKTKSEMISELKARNPAYIVSMLEASTEACIRDRYVYTFYKQSA